LGAAALALLLAAAGGSAYGGVYGLDLSGYWSGGWQSCTTGHKGPLKASFCRLHNGDYEVRFRGRFFRVIPFRYRVVLHVIDQQGDTVYLAGSSYLGRLFGTFEYQATATPSEFRATYTSKKDCGEFWMCRG